MDNTLLRILNNVSEARQLQDAVVTAKEYRGKAALVTLGCAKNQVDSEIMLGSLSKKGYEIVSEVEEADIAIINTCGFLESALQESIDAIIDVGSLKEEGKLRQLVVAGCMVERHGEEIQHEFPEVDLFIDTDQIAKVGELVGSPLANALDNAARPYFLYDDTLPRVLSTKKHTAYVKISEGCNRPCTFCIIPQIRGAMRSRDRDSILREVESLYDLGVKEINLVAQDLTSFGKDSKSGLAELLYALDKQGAVEWIRLLYAYPVGTTDELLSAINDLPRVCNYLDIPFQHVSTELLKKMKRPIGKLSPRNLTEYIKENYPSIALRSTFIVGFPGETEDQVTELESFIAEGHFENLGVFEYSPEKGTPSFEYSGHISAAERSKRREKIMFAQKEVIEEKLSNRIGQTERVLIEGFHEDTDLLLTARTHYQAPEVDCSVIINDGITEDTDPSSLQGQFIEVEFTDVAGYDLLATIRD